MTDHFAGIRVAAQHRRENPVENKATYRKKRQGGYGVSPAQDELVAFVQDTLKATGEVPSLEAIRVKLGWKQRASAKDCLQKCGNRLGALVVQAVLDKREVKSP